MTMWPWGLQLGRNTPSETAQAAYKGQLYQRRSDGIYLKDFGRGDSDDSAKLYSGQMLDFDGVDDYVDCGSLGSIPVHGFAFTAKLNDEVTPASTPADYPVLGFNNISYRGVAFGAFTSSYENELISFYVSSVKYGWLDAAGSISAGIHRFFIRWDETSGNYIISIDGEDKPTTCSGTPELEYLDELFLGYNTGIYGEGFLGDVQVWSGQEVTFDDVAYDFNNCFLGDITAANRPGTSLSPSNLKGWWKLIEGSGSTVYDWSGNGNHGTLVGFPTDDSQWVNAEQLSDPLVIQTALTEWGMGSNLTDHSSDFTSDWTLVRMSLGGSIVTPEGKVSTTSGIIPSTDADDHKIQSSYTHIGYKANTQYTLRAIVASGSQDVTRVANSQFLSDDTLVSRIEVDVNLDTNEYNVETVDGDITVDGVQITPVDATWAQIDVIITTGADDRPKSYLQVYTMEAMGDHRFPGDGVTVGTYVWVIQAFEGINQSVILGPPCTNALVPTRTWETAGQFLRTHGELNWNGRSYAVCGNQTDVNPSTALIIEAILTQDYIRVSNKTHYFARKGDAYRVYAYSLFDKLYFRVTQTDGTTTVSTPFTISEALTHFVFIFSPGHNLTCYKNGVEEGSEPLSGTGNLLIDPNMLRLSHGWNIVFQLPLLKMHINEKAQAIIDGDLDAWVQKQYLKAKAKYDL